MLHFLFTTGREVMQFTIWPVILLTILAPFIVALVAGRGGGRAIEGGEDAADPTRLPIMIASALGALTVLHLAVLITAGLAIRNDYDKASGIMDVLGSLFIAPYGVDRGRLGMVGALSLFASFIGGFAMWNLIRDGGALREQIDAIRDPGRVRGESGSAHFCTPREFSRFRKPDTSGLPFVGAFYGTKQEKGSGKRQYVRLDDGKGEMWISGEDIARGIMTIGGPGSGKTQSVILPSIADHMANGHSVIVVDPQGELTPHVMRYAAYTKHQVIVHDPTSKTMPRYNLGNGVTNVSDARSIATVLVPSEGGDNKFWSDSASMLLAGCLIRFDNLGQIYEGMSDMEMVGQRLASADDDAARLANSFIASLATDGKIASNVVAVLATALTGWADKTARDATSASDFTADMIVEQPTAVVLTCPGRMRAIYAPYLGAVVKKLMLDLDTIGERMGGPLPVPVGVIMDEFPTLGKLESLVADVNLVRKRRISIMIAAQTKGQFHMIYGPPATDALFAGMATQIIFGGGDQETADFYSKASGQATELTEDGGISLREMLNPESNIDQKTGKPQKRQRQLLTSDEIQTPARGNCTIFTRYVTASYATQLILWAKLTRSYEREDWKKRLQGLKPEDAMLLQRPLSFGVKQPAPAGK
jgi:hypothetical protein